MPALRSFAPADRDIVLQSRTGEEEAALRCSASVEFDDDAWAGCNATLWVALSMAPLSSLVTCDAPHRGASSFSHLLKDKTMKSLDNFSDGLLESEDPMDQKADGDRLWLRYCQYQETLSWSGSVQRASFFKETKLGNYHAAPIPPSP